MLAEVAALIALIKIRGYVQLFQEMHDRVVETGMYNQPVEFRIAVSIPDGFNRVYQANVSKLGALSTYEARQVVRFHQLIESFRAAVTEGGKLWHGASVPEPWADSMNVLRDAVVIGEQLSRPVKWWRRVLGAWT